MFLRPATADDAFAVATVHVAAWRETYRGLVPDALLDGLSVERRADIWARGAERVTLAEGPDGLAGFVATGPQEDEGLRQAGYGGEVLALYVLRRHQRQGIGRRLLAAAATALDQSGLEGAALWVLATNTPARDFYAALGAETVGERTEVHAGASLLEVACGWCDLSALTR